MKTDIVSFLNHYKEMFPESGLKKITGLNSKEIEDYTTGNKKPTVAKLKKIENAIRCFGQEIVEDVDVFKFLLYKDVGDIPNQDTIESIKEARSGKELKPIEDLSSWLENI
jgi:predicted transcriptional regulator